MDDRSNERKQIEMKSRDEIITETMRETMRTVHRGRENLPTHDEIISAATEIALDLAGFSDGIPQDSPRPPDLPPRTPGKTGNYGPTETRKAER